MFFNHLIKDCHIIYEADEIENNIPNLRHRFTITNKIKEKQDDENTIVLFGFGKTFFEARTDFIKKLRGKFVQDNSKGMFNGKFVFVPKDLK